MFSIKGGKNTSEQQESQERAAAIGTSDLLHTAEDAAREAKTNEDELILEKRNKKKN